METIVKYTKYIRENKVNILVAISCLQCYKVGVQPHSQNNKNSASLFQENCGETDNKEAGRQQHT